MNTQKRTLVIILLIAVLATNLFLILGEVRLVNAQSAILFSESFDTNQPNHQFTLGSDDELNNTFYVSSQNSLQVNPRSSPDSYATFYDSTGQLYVQILYATNNTGYSRIATLRGNTGWLSIYQDGNGIIFDWDVNANETNVLLTPNVWYNITLSVYLDPNHGTNSSAILWLNQVPIANQSMPQVDGYDLNTLTFEPSLSIQAVDNYDNIIVSTQPISTAQSSATPSPTPTSTPTPSSTSTSTSTLGQPTAALSPTTTPSSNLKVTTSTTQIPDPTQTPSSTPTIPEIPFVSAIAIFLAITVLTLLCFKKHTANHHPLHSF